MNAYVLPRLPYAPSGYPAGQSVVLIQNERAPASEAVRYYQRLLLGTGFSPGPQGADGIYGDNTANALQAWARWYNALPEGPMATPLSLTRGPMVAVNRLLDRDKQLALQRFAARSSDVLARVDSTQTTVVAPPPPEGTPWGTIIVGTVAVGTAVALFSFLSNRPSRKA